MAALAFESLRAPAFRAEDVDRLRGEILTSLREQDDDPGTVAERAWTSWPTRPDTPSLAGQSARRRRSAR